MSTLPSYAVKTLLFVLLFQHYLGHANADILQYVLGENETSEGLPVQPHSSAVNSSNPQRNLNRLPLGETRLPSKQLLRCQPKPVNWGNISTGQVLWLFGKEVEIFLNSDRRSVTKSQRASASTPDQLLKNIIAHQRCYVLFLYSTSCRFSLAAMPTVKAVARAYPQLDFVGIQVEDYALYRWSLRMLYVPKLKIVADGQIVYEYLGSDDDLYQIVDYICRQTRLLPRYSVEMRDSDHQDMPTLRVQTDWTLFASIIMTVVGMAYTTVMLVLHRKTVVRSLWCYWYGGSDEMTTDTGVLVPTFV